MATAAPPEEGGGFQSGGGAEYLTAGAAPKRAGGGGVWSRLAVRPSIYFPLIHVATLVQIVLLLVALTQPMYGYNVLTKSSAPVPSFYQGVRFRGGFGALSWTACHQNSGPLINTEEICNVYDAQKLTDHFPDLSAFEPAAGLAAAAIIPALILQFVIMEALNPAVSFPFTWWMSKGTDWDRGRLASSMQLTTAVVAGLGMALFGMAVAGGKFDEIKFLSNVLMVDPTADATWLVGDPAVIVGAGGGMGAAIVSFFMALGLWLVSRATLPML